MVATTIGAGTVDAPGLTMITTEKIAMAVPSITTTTITDAEKSVLVREAGRPSVKFGSPGGIRAMSRISGGNARLPRK